MSCDFILFKLKRFIVLLIPHKTFPIHDITSQKSSLVGVEIQPLELPGSSAKRIHKVSVCKITRQISCLLYQLLKGYTGKVGKAARWRNINNHAKV